MSRINDSLEMRFQRILGHGDDEAGEVGARSMSTFGFLRTIGLRLRGVRVSALVGRSGTGKSFRAHLIAEKRGIDIIIDDGLIIAQRTILCGQSSKKDRALIVGTSMEMVRSGKRRRHRVASPRECKEGC